MCFVTFKSQKPMIANEDIVCWKTLQKGTPKKGYPSIYQEYHYHKGEINPKVKLRKVSSDNGYAEIYDGYHSFSSLFLAERNAEIHYDRYLHEFIIPKGTKYYFNDDDEEYVSETIMMVK